MTVTIYTDGACSGNPGVGGAAAILSCKGRIKEISEGYRLTTNNRMELMSAILALRSITKPCDITLYSDSQYLVKAFTEGWLRQWKAHRWLRNGGYIPNADLWQELDALVEGKSIQFIWVKGHADNEGNSRCDELAVQAKSGALKEDEGYISPVKFDDGQMSLGI